MYIVAFCNWHTCKLASYLCPNDVKSMNHLSINRKVYGHIVYAIELSGVFFWYKVFDILNSNVNCDDKINYMSQVYCHLW